MKRIISIILLSIMFTYSFYQVNTFLSYLIDIKEYTEKYCENKDQPEMNCNGKCHLTKELAKKEENQQEKNIQQLPEINFFIQEKEAISTVSISWNPNEKTTFLYNKNLTDGVTSTLFQPPIEHHVNISIL